MTFCAMLAIICFCTAITFLNFAYFFYGPSIGGLAIIMSRTAAAEMDRRSLAAGKPQEPAPPILIRAHSRVSASGGRA